MAHLREKEMIYTVLVFVAGAYMGFRAGAKFRTLTAMKDALRDKIRNGG